MFRALAALLLFAAFSPPSLAAEPSWPQWRGPNRDGSSMETGLLKEWKEGEPTLAWKKAGLGSGFSSLAIADGRIITMGDRKGDKDKEQFVIALSQDGKKELWATKVSRGGEAGGFNGPRGTPTINGDRVYVIGLHGDLACLNADSGEIVWQRSFKDDFGGGRPGWGFTESPLVDGERLVCTPGGKDAAIVALDKANGDVIWKGKLGDGKTDGAAYSSIVISNGGGVKQYVQLMSRGLVSFRADDGKFLWRYDEVANGTANIPTPIANGDYVFASTGYGKGSALLKLGKTSDGIDAEEVYFLNGRTLQNHHGGLIQVGDHIYGGHGHGNGDPICVEAKTGEIAWVDRKPAGSGSAAVAYADGHLYFRYQDGTVALIEATPEEYKLKGKFKIPDVRDPSWSHPVVVGGKLYLREQDTLYCYDVKG